MEVKTYSIGPLETNVYIIIDSNNQAVIVDPASQAQALIKIIDELSIQLKGILVTHCHYDHVSAVDTLAKHYNVPVYTHSVEASMMENPSLNMSKFYWYEPVVVHATNFVEHGDVISFSDELTFKCLIVPGHTHKSVCYYNELGKLVVTGDTLMAGTMGRTDFYEDLNEDLAQNIKTHILTLPEDTKVLPGHGESTTVSNEMKYNPFL